MTRIAFQKRCPRCGSRRIYREPPRSLILVLAKPDYYECDGCGCPFVVLHPFLKAVVILLLLGTLGYACLGFLIHGWSFPLSLILALSALALLFHVSPK